MKKILLVEDDKLVAGIYQKKLAEAGFEVAVAEDGLAALKQLPTLKPDLVILDLLMPKLSGVDVLKFMQTRPELKSTRVIVFSNAFLNKLGEQVAAMAVDQMLLKSAVTPTSLIAAIQNVLERPHAEPASSTPVETATAVSATPTPKPPSPPRAPSVAASAWTNTGTSFRTRLRHDFFDQIPLISKSLRQVTQDFLASSDVPTQLRHLEIVSRKVGFLTHMAGMAGCHRIAQLSSALEALVFELREKPASISESPKRTIDSTITFLTDCLSRAEQADEQCLSPTTVLVVDDDTVSTRALVLALGRVQLVPTGVSDPAQALERLQKNTYDVVLLDLNMPGMDGITLCQRMRELPLHRQTPVIFITGYTDFAARARSILSGNEDLISKPILPVELVVKAIAYVVKRRLAAETA